MHNHEKFPENQLHQLSKLIVEMKNELIEFVSTRFELFRSEIREAASAWRAAAPLGLAAIVLLFTGYLLLTLAVVGLIAVAFAGNPYAWFFAFLITGSAWCLFGAVAAYLAYNSLRQHGIFPRKTIEVLKADKLWIENEVGSQI